METRKVQQVGYSTLAVSLPKDWTKEVGLSRGDVVTLKREGNQILVFPGIELEEKEILNAEINADLCDEQELMTRIITGSYIIGCDTIKILFKRELNPKHLREIRNATRFLTGIDIVEQTSDHVSIQSFVDPSRFPVEGLIRRLHIIASSMQLNSTRALFERNPELTNEVLHMEEEADRIYWLILRQLILTQRGYMKIGSERSTHIIGDRIIAKSMEEIADYAADIAKEVSQIITKDYTISPEILEDFSQLNEMVHDLLNKTMEALSRKDIKRANEVIEKTSLVDKKERSLATKIVEKITEVNVATTIRSILLSLRQISRQSKIIAEITINRALMTPSKIYKTSRT